MTTIDMTPEEALSHLWDVKAQIEELEDVKRRLSEFLESVDPDELRFDRGDKHYRAVVTRSTSTKVNLLRLAALNPALFDQITKPVVDTEKLKDSIDSGLWTAELRDECVTFTQSRPAVRFSEYVSGGTE